MCTGAYYAEKAHPPQEKHAPAYSFGKKTHIPSRHPTPSPSAYTLPSLIGPNTVGKKSVPAYSMTGRSKIGGFAEDLRKVSLCSAMLYKSISSRIVSVF